MQNSENSIKASFIQWKYKGSLISENQYNQIKSRVDNYTYTNNQLLKQLNLYSGSQINEFYAIYLPNKYSEDLWDLEATCMTQRLMIDKIKQLRNDLDLSYMNHKLNLSQRQQIVSSQNKQIDRLKSQIKALNSQIIRKDMKIEQLNDDEKKLIKTIKQKQKTIKFCKDEIRNSKNKHQTQLRTLNFKLMNKGNHKSQHQHDGCIIVEKKDQIQHYSPIMPNSQDKISNIKKASQKFKQFQMENQKNIEENLIQENNILKNLVKKFVMRLDKILQNYLARLRQNHLSQVFKMEKYQYLPKIHLNFVNNIWDHDFPFDGLLDDFEAILIQAEKYKLEKEKYISGNRNQVVNRQQARQIINQLRKISSLVITEFQLCSKKRRQLAQLYRDILPDININYKQLISKTTIEKIRKFQQLPNRILNQIQAQINDFLKHSQKIKHYLRSNEPSFFIQRVEINTQLNAHVDQQCNHERKSKQKQEYFQRHETKQQLMKDQHESNILVDNIQDPSKILQRQQDFAYEIGKNWILDVISRQPLQQEYSERQKQALLLTQVEERNRYFDELLGKRQHHIESNRRYRSPNQQNIEDQSHKNIPQQKQIEI